MGENADIHCTVRRTLVTALGCLVIRQGQKLSLEVPTKFHIRYTCYLRADW